jgi:Rho-binding antiterminator
MADKKYEPVNCDFHDDLESLITLRKQAVITYRDQSDHEAIAQGHVVDLFTKDHEEFLKMSDGLTLRLDRVTSVNGRNPDAYARN